jgi:tRNA threonylcarbamoyladenosine biosynthesis protein TsaB
MILLIDTSKNQTINIGLIKDGKIARSMDIPSEFSQAEKLLPSIDKLLKEERIDQNSIEKIRVSNTGQGFTSLRIGVATANALGYALGIPVASMEGNNDKKNRDFDIVEPKYSSEPNITIKKRKIVD